MDQLSWHPSRLSGDGSTYPANIREAKVAFPPSCIATNICQSDALRPDLNWKLREVEGEAGVKHLFGMWILADAAASNLLGQFPSAFQWLQKPAFCSFAICGLSGKAPMHNKSYKYESGAESC